MSIETKRLQALAVAFGRKLPMPAVQDAFMDAGQDVRDGIELHDHVKAWAEHVAKLLTQEPENTQPRRSKLEPEVLIEAARRVIEEQDSDSHTKALRLRWLIEDGSPEMPEVATLYGRADEDGYGGEFDEERALADLLYDNQMVLTVRDGTLAVLFNCSDTFAWGCADAEPVHLGKGGDLRSLYAAWKTGLYGPTMWVCKKRGQRPQAPLEERMRTAGAWDDEMEALQ